ncbi:hypothetical protein [Paenirhodobacter sp.]|uniref:hypothetical protein n=1 Tax=Paenirhodobacter sp. TaxID=1965326 RepID=UPI003B4046F4
MADKVKIAQGTPAWFEMVGSMMSEAAARAHLPEDLNVSLVERYIDGAEIFPGRFQGLRFDIKGGRPSFKVGVTPDEMGDIVIEVTLQAARSLNLIPGTDPEYQAARNRFAKDGSYRVNGDLSKLGSWLKDIHDPIVNRTA